jgi:molybdate transport system substrate-binding protein
MSGPAATAAMPAGGMASPAMSGSGMSGAPMASSATSAGAMASGGMSGGMAMMSGAPAITGAPGSLIIVAPGALAGAVPLLDEDYIAAHPGSSLSPNLGHSSAQVLQLQQGSPGDVLLTVGSGSMGQAQKDGLLTSGTTVFARNCLEIVVAAGNPRHITSLADLAKPGLTVVVPDQSTPVGVYAAQALKKAGVTVKPASLEEGSAEAAAKVATGNADAAIVFATDVLSYGGKVAGIGIPSEDQVPAEYDAAVLRSARDADAARAYVAFLTTPAAQSELRALGFLSP